MKNFGVVYEDVLGEAPLAPVYDLVTTSVYFEKDALALALNGSTAWPDAKVLQRLGETRMRGTPSQIGQLFERISEAVSETIGEIRAYRKDHPEFEAIGKRMIEEWEKGRKQSLRLR